MGQSPPPVHGCAARGSLQLRRTCVLCVSQVSQECESEANVDGVVVIIMLLTVLIPWYASPAVVRTEIASPLGLHTITSCCGH